MATKVIFSAAMILVLLVFPATPVVAWTPSNLTIRELGGDQFWNYDFEQENWDEVDWPINMVFWNDAATEKVKDILWGATGDRDMNGRLNDGPENNWNWVWNADEGTREASSGDPGAHLRVYAADDFANYNDWLGYYVLGTTHFDNWYRGYWAPFWFGFSEYSEDDISEILRNKGYSVLEDYFWLDNYEPSDIDSRWDWEEGVWVFHVWQNNGYASFVMVE